MEKKDWRHIEYFVPIKESVSNNGEFIIKGVAINEGITRNGVMYEGVELEKAAPSMKGKPLLKDHENKVENIVGKVKNAVYNRMDSNINFEAKIIDKKMQEMISDGRIENVSIGATVQDIVMNEGEDFVTAKGLDFVELSLVAVPGDAGATFAKACMESFKLKEASKPMPANMNLHKLSEADKMKMVCEKCGHEAMAMTGDKCSECGGPMKKMDDKEEEKMSDDTEKIRKELAEAQEKLKTFESEKAKIAEEKRINEEVERRIAEAKAKEAEEAAKQNATKGKVGQKADEGSKSNVIIEKIKEGFSYTEESYSPKLSRFQR